MPRRMLCDACSVTSCSWSPSMKLCSICSHPSNPEATCHVDLDPCVYRVICLHGLHVRKRIQLPDRVTPKHVLLPVRCRRGKGTGRGVQAWPPCRAAAHSAPAVALGADTAVQRVSLLQPAGAWQTLALATNPTPIVQRVARELWIRFACIFRSPRCRVLRSAAAA